MIFDPTVIALLTGSFLLSLMLCYSSIYAARILRDWDIRSGSEIQLALERRTYLISNAMAYMLGFQLLSLFLFIHAADSFHPLFVGAMCAAGTLYVNAWGYPTILAKLVSFLLAGVWLILNHVDNKGFDYPLIKTKYFLLLVITPFILAETALQAAYFLGLNPEIITSCCGTLFSSDSEAVGAGVLVLPRRGVQFIFFSSMALTFASGATYYLMGKGGYLFSASTLLSFLVAIAALISFISLYFYALPTHHCPFCLLHEEYTYVGYALYAALLMGSAAGLGVGATMPFGDIESLRHALPDIQRRLTLAALIGYFIFLIISLYGVLFSDLRLEGY